MICVVIEYANDDRGYRMLEALRTLGEDPWTGRATLTGRLMVLFNVKDRPREVVTGVVMNAEHAGGLTDEHPEQSPADGPDVNHACPRCGRGPNTTSGVPLVWEQFAGCRLYREQDAIVGVRPKRRVYRARCTTCGMVDVAVDFAPGPAPQDER